MRLLIPSLLLLASGLYAGTIPVFNIALSVNGDSLANGTINIGEAPGGGFTFLLSLDGVTVNGLINSDPVIDFGMSFGNGSDPTVQFSITTPYSGGPYTNLLSTTDGTLGSFSGNASVTPLAGQTYIQTVNVLDNSSNVVASLQQNTGCSTLAFGDVLCPASTAIQSIGSFAAVGGLQIEENFILSAGDTYVVNGSTTLSSATPEPATAALLGAGLLAIAALARRRAKAS